MDADAADVVIVVIVGVAGVAGFVSPGFVGVVALTVSKALVSDAARPACALVGEEDGGVGAIFIGAAKLDADAEVDAGPWGAFKVVPAAELSLDADAREAVWEPPVKAGATGPANVAGVSIADDGEAAASALCASMAAAADVKAEPASAAEDDIEL